MPPPDGGADSSEALLEERHTSSIELLWDLVFVFAVTQVTTLLSRQTHLERIWRGDARARARMVGLVGVRVGGQRAGHRIPCAADLSAVRDGLHLIAGLALPRAFRDESTLFAVSYAVVRFLHLALYADASRQGNAAWSAIAGFAATVVIGMGLLIAGSFLGGVARAALWAAAIAIDYAGPAWLTRERLRSLQRVAVAHFAERYGLFVIICLGESIVAIGVGAYNRPLTAARVTAVSLGLVTTIGMWWTYFDRFAATAETRLREHEDPVLAAADGYSYLHLLIVAGIIIFAVGIRFLVKHNVGAPLADAARLCLCAGVALYLIGNAAFRLRMVGAISYEKLVIAAALIAVYALSAGFAGWVTAMLVTALVGMLCMVESLRDREVPDGE